MVHEEIVMQARLFVYAVGVGAGLLVCYDLLRIFRRILKHGTIAVAVEDLLFWFFCAVGLFGFMYRENNGVIRGFLLLGAATGMILYSVFLSRWIVRGGTAASMTIVHAVNRILIALGAPFRFLWRIFGQRFGKKCLFLKKIVRSVKKRLKKAAKAVRMGISKL